MGTLRFSDGVSFDTDGAMRVEYRSDGYYVVGEGWLIPVDSHEAGKKYIADRAARAAARQEKTS
jgi:hypothetical protein